MKVWLALVLVLSAPMATGLSAQQNQPIYPAYDGFLKNPDGSYTLAFAYFSHNASDVTIAPGPNNSFAPTPGDRHAADHLQARPLALSVRDGGGPGVRRQDEMDADLCRRHDRHQRAHAAIELEPRRRRAGAVEDRLREGAERRVPQSRARGARARRHRAAEWSAADVDCGAQRRTESVRQRAGRRPAARQGPGDRMEAIEGTGHGELHHSRRGAHEGDILRAGTVRARTDRKRFRVRTERTRAERHASSEAACQKAD